MKRMARAFVGFGCIGLLVFLQGQLCAAPEPDREAIAVRSEAAAKIPTKPEGRGVIYVPDDYPAIQGAIDAASNDDTVIVREGTYYENINFLGKTITVRSTDPEDPAVVEATVINGNHDGRCVTFDSGEGPLSVLSGFTVRGGLASAAGGTIGGGIACFASSPTLTYNYIIHNNADFGAGISCIDGSPLISNNRIFWHCTLANAAGIYCESSGARIENNLIEGNFCYYGGGGIGCSECSGIQITGNTIFDNYCHYGAGGISLVNCEATVAANTIEENKCQAYGGTTYGGGIYCEGGSIAISGNELWDNFANSGAAISCRSGATVVMEGNTIAHHISSQEGTVSCFGSSVTMNHNILVDNYAPRGSGIYLADQSDVSLTNDLIAHNYDSEMGAITCYSADNDCSLQVTSCTIVLNESHGIYIYQQQDAQVTNSILWGNGRASISAAGGITVSYSDVEEGWSGAGNIDGYPLFLDPAGGDYRLAYGSPCIDTGSAVGNPRDREGDSRPLDGDASGTAEHDMGADEYNGGGVDSDGDGLVDALELSFGTDPEGTDTDGDGVSDYDEVNYDGDPDTYDPYDPGTGEGTDLNATDPDTDGDGYTDYIELESGTDPIDQESKPGILRLNFQPVSSDIPPGFLKDNGGGYTGRGYGWL